MHAHSHGSGHAHDHSRANDRRAIAIALGLIARLHGRRGRRGHLRRLARPARGRRSHAHRRGRSRGGARRLASRDPSRARPVDVRLRPCGDPRRAGRTASCCSCSGSGSSTPPSGGSSIRSDVHGGIVLVVALVGVAVNLAATLVLARADRSSLNVEGAFLHIATDLVAVHRHGDRRRAHPAHRLEPVRPDRRTARGRC